MADTIWMRRDELSLAGEERTATVMFTDIRGFTALSANQPPAQVLGWLNRYLEAMDEVIREHGGFLMRRTRARLTRPRRPSIGRRLSPAAR